MPKKMKRHIVKFLGVTVGYFTIKDGLERAHLLMSVVSKSDPYEKIANVVTTVFIAIIIWFCWRFYTGMYRDGDFLD